MLTHGRQYLPAALAALSLTTALGADTSRAAVPGAKPGTAAKAPNERPAAHRTEPLKLKTFTLKQANPEMVRQTLVQVWPRLSAGHGASEAAQQMPHVAVNPRTHTLFVRGSQSALDTVAELIELLDGDSDKETASLKNLTLVRLRHAPSQEVQQILQQLGLQDAVLALPQMNLVAVLKSGNEAQEIEDVIREVDRPASSEKSAQKTTSDKAGQKTTGADKKQPRKGPASSGD